jgi:hypothetical protein
LATGMDIVFKDMVTVMIIELIVDEEDVVMGEIKVVVAVVVEVIKCGKLIKITRNRNK